MEEGGGGEGACNAEAVGAQSDVELYLAARAALRAEAADRVLVAAHGWRAVDGPRDRLQEGRFPRPVGPEDPREPGPELELGVRVLAEVHEAEPVQLHQPSGSPPGRPTYSPPSRTNSPRSRSASSGRAPRNSATVSRTVGRRTR